MKKLIILFISIILITNTVYALTPVEILNKVDNNEVFKTIKYSGEMTIKKGSRKRPRVKSFKAVAMGKDKSYIAQNIFCHSWCLWFFYEKLRPNYYKI